MKLNQTTQKLYSWLVNQADGSCLIQVLIGHLAAELNLSFNMGISPTKWLESRGLITVTRGQRSNNSTGKESAGNNIYRIISAGEGK